MVRTYVLTMPGPECYEKTSHLCRLSGKNTSVMRTSCAGGRGSGQSRDVCAAQRARQMKSKTCQGVDFAVPVCHGKEFRFHPIYFTYTC